MESIRNKLESLRDLYVSLPLRGPLNLSSFPPTSNQQEKPNYHAAKLALRGLGLLDLMAVLAVIAPRPIIAQLHKMCGLGVLPEGPIVGYLVRSASFLYALHGAMILFASLDPARYQPLIRFIAWAAVLHGFAMFAIDMIEPMPFWWRCAEGLGFAATGVIVLWSLPRQSQSFTDSAS